MTSREGVRRCALAAIAVALSACAPRLTSAPALTPPTLASFRAARARLAALRATIVPRTLRVALTLREPVTGRVLEARGALAVAPPASLRMILLGPGGTTALDLWIQGDAYRFAVPAIDLLKRGDASSPREARRGLPVDFLRWWLLHPADGRLLWASRDASTSTSRFMLRDGDALVDLHATDGDAVVARRTTWTLLPTPRVVDDETVDAERLGCGKVRYHQASTGLEVTVRCEGEEPSTPSPRAFIDPDTLREEEP
jgi:hypothetical protein